jgi:NAD(P)-dependent dehydrogenase (short-subunit alcohol dehydrogenase family)
MTPSDPAGIDPAELEACLRVLARVEALAPEHPDAVAVRRAVGGLFKTVKLRRRAERREAVRAADGAVTAATATGAPGRIDDETQGLAARGRRARREGGDARARAACYVCKARYREVDAFYHQLCPSCAALNHERRDARTDLRGRRALLTGGRAKIGMYIALRLLRDGAHTTITTRFPRDAVRRFARMPDSGEWLDRLRIVGTDLRDPGQVVALADSVAARGTARHPHQQRRPDRAPVPRGLRAARRGRVGAAAGRALPEVESLGRTRDAHPAMLAGGADGHWAPTPGVLVELALTAGSAALERVGGNGGVIDAGGLVPDPDDANSWSRRVEEVDPVELLEVQLCNITAPFVLVSRLRSAMAASAARRTYVVNVSAMEGQFARGYKGPGHPHTNMAKAALNMLTRTSARSSCATGS